jgi:predicted aspartyl protease
MGLISKQVLVRGNKASRRLRVLMDTGTSHTVIRAATARRLATPAPLPRTRSAQFASGKGRIKETVNVSLRLDGREVFTSALVLEGLSEELVIGAEFFQRYKVVLDPEREEIRFTDPEALKVKII